MASRFPLFNPVRVKRGKEVVDADSGWHMTFRKEVLLLHQSTSEVAGTAAEAAVSYPEDPAISPSQIVSH